MVTYEVVTIPRFGECLKLENNHAELLISLDYGPRILSYRLTDGSNIFFEDTERKIFEDEASIESFFGMGSRWYMYGGHRFWVAPETVPETYFPDNRTVDYEILEDGKGVVLNQMDQIKNGLRLSIQIMLEKDSAVVQVSHSVKNIGKTQKELAPWAITTLAPEGVCVFEMPTLYKAFLPNRSIAVWPYTDLKDSRLSIGTRYITLAQDPKNLKACKIGTDNQAGYGAYIKGDTIFIVRYDHQQDGIYPDKGVSFETYTNGFFLELETLGELVTLAPGETETHKERWELRKAKSKFDPEDEGDIEKFVIANIGAFGRSKSET